jgi:hypothetical protein
MSMEMFLLISAILFIIEKLVFIFNVLSNLMKIVKSESLKSHEALAAFINEMKIEKDDIISVVPISYTSDSSHLVILFYGDPNVDQKKKKAFGISRKIMKRYLLFKTLCQPTSYEMIA